MFPFSILTCLSTCIPLFYDHKQFPNFVDHLKPRCNNCMSCHHNPTKEDYKKYSSSNMRMRVEKQGQGFAREFHESPGQLGVRGNWWCSGQTTCLSPLRFRVRSPVRFILMWTRRQSSCEKCIVNAQPKVVGFLRFPPTGKVDRGVR